MFRRTCMAALAALTAIVGLTALIGCGENREVTNTKTTAPATPESKQAAANGERKISDLAADRGSNQTTNSIGMKLTLIPSGEFMMGSGESAEDTADFFKKTLGEDRLSEDSFTDEYPQHRVRITKPFYLGTYHVTRGQFRQFVKDSGYKTDAEKGDHPAAFGLERREGND